MTTLRCLAVGFRIDPERTVSTDALRASVRRLVDDHLPPRDPPPDDHGPATLVAFPEHTGLIASLVGPRAQGAREALAAGRPAQEILTALAFGYGDQLGHYAQAFPEATSPGQLLHLALTDTVVRVLHEAFGGLAAERGWWVTVGAALPPFERVSDQRVGTLAALEGDRTYAYVATDPGVRNSNLVFGPDGGLAAIHHKAYLVPMERDRAEGLGLTGVGVDEVTVADLPIGRLGTVISKDAWMPDVNERLDQLGARLLVQPEAFDRWGRVAREERLADLWPPDKLQRGGWWMVQHHPAFRVNLTPMLVGNLGDLAFDGQPFVAVPAPAGVDGLGLLGQSPDAGWAAVGPWNHLDEPPTALADPARRAEFDRLGRRMAPGSGDALEGAVAEGVACAEVRLPDWPAAVAELPSADAAGPSVAVAPAHEDRTDLVADLVAADDRAWLAWVACGGPLAQGVVVASGDGRRWATPTPVAPRPRRPDDAFDRQWRPRLADADGTLVCAHLAFPDESWDLFAATSEGDGWSGPVRLDDADRIPGVIRERGHDAPVLAVSGGSVLAAWSDLRWPWVLPQVRVSVSTDRGGSWSASRRVDGGPLDGQEDPLAGRSTAETRGQASPAAVGLGGGWLVAWQEPPGPGEGPGVRTTLLAPDGRPDPPRLAAPVGWRPALAVAAGTVWLVVEEPDEAGGSRLVVRAGGGEGWGGAVPVDADRPAGAVQRRAVAVALDGGVAVVFEDDRAGRSRVLAVVVDAAGRPGPVRRVDDAPSGADARAPAAARLAGRLLVVWQDTRDGVERLRSTTVDPARLR